MFLLLSHLSIFLNLHQNINLSAVISQEYIFQVNLPHEKGHSKPIKRIYRLR